MKKLFLSTLLMLIALTASAQVSKEVHILSINDPHAAIEQFPRLGFVADSLRALYPDLLILQQVTTVQETLSMICSRFLPIRWWR